MDIVESVKRCVDSPSVSCCSRRLYGTIILLWHLIYAKNWLTTKELCERAKFHNCNEARVYLYRLKERGVVITDKIHTGETIWRINEEALRKTDPRTFIRLLTLHYNICTEYYKTGNLKKPIEKEDIEEEEFEEEDWEDIEEE